jgi:deoxyribodipyrimidine photo-lyase
LQPVSIVWHRGDLRTHDHPALVTALQTGPAIGLVVFDDNILYATSARRRALFALHVSALRASCASRGGLLFVRTGKPEEVLPQFVREVAQRIPVAGIHALRSYSPCGTARDRAVANATLVPIHWHDGLYVHSPGTIRTTSNSAFSVYAAYRKAWRAAGVPEPFDSPRNIDSPAQLAPVPIGEIPSYESDVILPAAGEDNALRRATSFLDKRVANYGDTRDKLDGSGSSQLSVDITIGALSTRTIVAAAWERRGAGPAKWIDEIIWRDFLADMLFHRPELVTEPFSTRWNAFQWNESESDFAAWRDGRTGIPAVDAAMRQLHHAGWISNRARMVAAQFLTKHLRIHWTRGARVFHDWLLDGDVASNTGNWQWSAGLGIDNAPYFRVFNPVTQATQHDPDGAWIRKWVPESNGDPRPQPNAIVDLKHARREYLAEAARTSLVPRS